MKRLAYAVLAIVVLLSGVALAEHPGKIAVATRDKSPEAAVSDKAALAPYFLIFDERGALVEAIDNPLRQKPEAGKLMAGFFSQKGVTAVIGTDYCGDIIGILKNGGLTAYNFEGTAAQAALTLAQGKLHPAAAEETLVQTHKVMVDALRTGHEKIAVAANGSAPGSTVNTHLASSPYFLIFDQKRNLLEAVENPYKGAESPGPDIVNFLSGRGATVVIAGDFGPKIVDVMKAKRIWPIRFNGSAQDALAKVLR